MAAAAAAAGITGEDSTENRSGHTTQAGIEVESDGDPQRDDALGIWRATVNFAGNVSQSAHPGCLGCINSIRAIAKRAGLAEPFEHNPAFLLWRFRRVLSGL